MDSPLPGFFYLALVNTLLAKLKLKTDEPLLVLNAPDSVITILKADEVPLHTKPQNGCTYPVMLCFVHSVAELNKWAPLVITERESETFTWFAYPKKSSGIKTDINRDAGWDYLVNQGYGPVSAISINEVWSALRFKPEAEVNRQGSYRPNQGPPAKSLKTLLVPDYITKLLAKNPNEQQFFSSLAYTYRKEYVSWIAEAKQEQTRNRRLAQFIDLLREKKKMR